jgi:hypothetical protein
MRVVKGMGVVPRQSSLEIGPDSLEQPTLNVGDFEGCGTIRIIIHHGIDPTAHGIASNQAGIAGFQHIGPGFDLCHVRIEPKFVGIGIKDQKPVVDG